MLIEIRTGKWSLDRLSSYINQLFTELDAAENASALPDTADRKRLSTIVDDAYLGSDTGDTVFVRFQ